MATGVMTAVVYTQNMQSKYTERIPRGLDLSFQRSGDGGATKGSPRHSTDSAPPPHQLNKRHPNNCSALRAKAQNQLFSPISSYLSALAVPDYLTAAAPVRFPNSELAFFNTQGLADKSLPRQVSTRCYRC